ncbi:hypothetical protein [Clostridium sp. YIM B02506]|uniref:hypothetical protein n=1 Tax=Clostridium sp. YIM B02506 TaxID=2910680 RepID=UPI001EED3583|nr:hypothetical protein [Clostridium sp. YIM B02506]
MTESILTRISLEVEYKADLDKERKDEFKKQSFIGIDYKFMRREAEIIQPLKYFKRISLIHI